MLKDDLLKLLEDPDVVAKVKEVLSSKQIITASDKRKATILTKWWSSNLKTPVPTLENFQIKEIASKVNQYGYKELMKILQMAIDSPLNKEGEFMRTYLSDITWCLKDSNLNKIKAGKYSKKFTSGKQEVFKNKDEEDFEFNDLLK